MNLAVTGLAVALGCAGVAFAQDAPLTRDAAGYWVHTITGTEDVAPHGRIRISSRGTIVLRGVASDHISYKLTQRVRAASEDEANRRIGSGQLDNRPGPGVARLVISQISSPLVANRLEVDVPKGLASAVLDTQMFGNIEVYDFDGDVEARTRAGEIVADRIKGSVSANTAGGAIRLGKIGGSVECYTGAGSISIESAGGGVRNCRTAGGEILVKNAGGPVSLANDEGNISVDHAASSVEAHATSGVIKVTQAGGFVIADTRGGSIQVGAARGVKAQSDSGAVRVRGTSGPLDISTMVGNIVAELAAGSRLQNSSLAAGSGDITVLIPSNLALSVTATNDTGGTPRIISDFSEVRANMLGFARPPLIARGAIDGGGPMLDVNTGGGVIYLRKAK